MLVNVRKQQNGTRNVHADVLLLKINKQKIINVWTIKHNIRTQLYYIYINTKRYDLSYIKQKE